MTADGRHIFFGPDGKAIGQTTAMHFDNAYVASVAVGDQVDQHHHQHQHHQQPATHGRRYGIGRQFYDVDADGNPIYDDDYDGNEIVDDDEEEDEDDDVDDGFYGSQMGGSIGMIGDENEDVVNPLYYSENIGLNRDTTNAMRSAYAGLLTDDFERFKQEKTRQSMIAQQGSVPGSRRRVRTRVTPIMQDRHNRLHRHDTRFKREPIRDDIMFDTHGMTHNQQGYDDLYNGNGSGNDNIDNDINSIIEAQSGGGGRDDFIANVHANDTTVAAVADVGIDGVLEADRTVWDWMVPPDTLVLPKMTSNYVER